MDNDDAVGDRSERPAKRHAKKSGTAETGDGDDDDGGGSSRGTGGKLL